MQAHILMWKVSHSFMCKATHTLCWEQQLNFNVSIQNVLRVARTVTSHVSEFYALLFVFFLPSCSHSYILSKQTNFISLHVQNDFKKKKYVTILQKYETIQIKVEAEYGLSHQQTPDGPHERGLGKFHGSISFLCMCPWFKQIWSQQRKTIQLHMGLLLFILH